jgi:peptidylprolyl isomerase
MKLRLLAAAIAAMTLTVGAAAAQDTSTEKGKLSYAIGYNTGAELAELAERGEAIDIETVVQALRDAHGRKDPAVGVDDLRQAVENMQRRQQAKMQAEFQQVANANKTASDAFLAQNRAKAGVQVLPSGVQYRVIEPGAGAKPTQASEVQLSYKGSLPDGTVLVDTSRAPEGAPAGQQAPGPITLKLSQVPLEGLREVLLQMPTGARWEVVLPGDKAYGSDIRAGRMANQAVVFDLKLVSVK